MHPNDKIYIAGHRGLVGSALMRRLSPPTSASSLDSLSRELGTARDLAGNVGRPIDPPRFIRHSREGGNPGQSDTPFVAEKVCENLKSAERDELIKHHGYKAMDHHE